ncbi:MAG TPA: M28 family metallopeptidase [Thermoanaerobaculia bacterium]|nr:M28 family metallopeptidase [Thermoanaerobaculia bacterium]
MSGAARLLLLLPPLALLAAVPAAAGTGRDPAEPPTGTPAARLPALTAPTAPADALPRGAVHEAALRATVEELAACGTRQSLSSWTDPRRGIGCGRDHVLARFEAVARASGGRLQVMVDRFEAESPRTGGKPAHLENVLAFLPGSDPALARTVFLVSGHYDSMPSSVLDPVADAPGADDDASGVAVAVECARLLAGDPGKRYRATLLFAAVSGEEQGLLGGTRLRDYLKQNGYTVGGFLDNDIVGADFAPGGPHRVRLFSSGGPDGVDSPSRDLARAVEEIAGRDAVRLIFRLDRLGRGGDHRPFVEAGMPAVRFTEPLEDYAHEHQTPRSEGGREYGDLVKFLDFSFLGDVARVNAEALRQLALAPAAPGEVTVAGGVTPSARLAWTASPDPQRAGFEVLWRETTDPRWSVLEAVPVAGDGSGAREAQVVLTGVSTDNHFFAVRAVGADGARSVPVAAVLKPPPPKP